MLIYHCEDFIPIGYTDFDFQSDLDFKKSTSGCVFTLGGGDISWRSIKQSCIADSTMEAQYVAACEVAKQAVWLKGKHIERKYHIIQDIEAQGDVLVAKITSTNNLVNPFTKALHQKTFESHLKGMGVRLMRNSL